MQIKSRKFLSVLLTLLMMAGVIAIAPVTASASGPPDDPNGTAVWDLLSVTADGSGPGWDWVNSTRTLTLTNFSHSTSADTALRLPGGATIVLVGANTITSTFSSTSGSSDGIFCSGALTIKGSGSLDVKSGKADEAHGIYANGGILTFSEAVTVNATSGPGRATVGLYSNLKVIIDDSAAVTAEHGPASTPGMGYTIYVGTTGGVTVNGGSLTVLATEPNYLFNTAYTVPAGYSYWFNSAKSATGAFGPHKSNGNPAYDRASISLQYVKIAAPVAPAITTASLPGGTVGAAYSQTLAATGDTPITWTVDSGSLPGGLTLSAAGVISGTPTAAGTFSVTVTANNGVAPNATKTLSIVVAAAKPDPGIFGTNPKWDGKGSHWWHYLLFFLCFGFIWMWF